MILCSQARTAERLVAPPSLVAPALVRGLSLLCPGRRRASPDRSQAALPPPLTLPVLFASLTAPRTTSVTSVSTANVGKRPVFRGCAFSIMDGDVCRLWQLQLPIHKRRL